MMHDSTVDRTTDGQGVVADLTAAYVLSLHAAERFGGRFPNELVPSLEQALRTADSSGLSLILDVLWQNRVSVATQVAVITRVIGDVGSHKAVSVMSTDTVFLKAMHGQAPGTPLILNPDNYQPWHIAFCRRTGVAAILYWPQTLADRSTATRVWEMAQTGFQIYVSTTNDPTFGDSLAATIPIAGMLTDLPPTVFRLGLEAR